MNHEFSAKELYLIGLALQSYASGLFEQGQDAKNVQALEKKVLEVCKYQQLSEVAQSEKGKYYKDWTES